MEFSTCCGSNEALTSTTRAEVPGWTEPSDPPASAYRVSRSLRVVTVVKCYCLQLEIESQVIHLVLDTESWASFLPYAALTFTTKGLQWAGSSVLARPRALRLPRQQLAAPLNAKYLLCIVLGTAKMNVYLLWCLQLLAYNNPAMETQHQDMANQVSMATEAQEKSTIPTDLQYQVAVPLHPS